MEATAGVEDSVPGVVDKQHIGGFTSSLGDGVPDLGAADRVGQSDTVFGVESPTGGGQHFAQVGEVVEHGGDRGQIRVGVGGGADEDRTRTPDVVWSLPGVRLAEQLVDLTHELGRFDSSGIELEFDAVAFQRERDLGAASLQPTVQRHGQRGTKPAGADRDDQDVVDIAHLAFADLWVGKADLAA